MKSSSWKLWNRPPTQSHVFCNFSSLPHRRHFFNFTTDNESKKMWKTSTSPKSPKPQKPIIQKRSILALFRLPYIGQYVRFSAMELKWSFLRGPAHKIEKRPFFAKKRKIEEQQKGFEVATCLSIIISSPTRASDPPRALKPSLWLPCQNIKQDRAVQIMHDLFNTF